MNDHPQIELLKNYLNNSEADKFSALRLHLAECSECRQLLNGLMALQAISSHSMKDDLSDQEYQNIANFIDSNASTTDSQQTRDFIENNPQALKAALHYASQQSAMQTQNIRQTPSTGSTFKVGPGLSSLLDKAHTLLSFQTPLWISASFASAFIALFSFSLINSPSSNDHYNIVSYQDNAIVQFRPVDQVPGIGFFARDEVVSRNFNGLDVSISGEGVFTLSWPAITDAIRYDLHLVMFDKGERISLANISTESNSVILQTELDTINHRYEWELTGETTDHQLFQASGGFVINDMVKGNR